MARPIDLPPREYFLGLPCGVRAKYIAGCRCVPCRAANSRYESERLLARHAGDWNGLVSTAAAQEHLRALRRWRVGLRAVAAASDVTRSTLQGIKNGRVTQIRRRTEQRILAVDRSCVSDHALVSAKPAWRLLNRLLADGYPAVRLCRMLGFRSQGLQFGRERMTAKNVRRVQRFYRDVMGESDGNV